MYSQLKVTAHGLLDDVATELELIRYSNNTDCTTLSFKGQRYNDVGEKFPIGCLQLLKSLPGNNYCVDCGSANPDWASITYGTLMCLQCSGIHRSYGVQVSYVRSLQYDTWNHQQILSMLEGGNTQLRTFFHRHQLLNNANCDDNNNVTSTISHYTYKSAQELYNQRYHTKAALFYKVNLKQHVQNVAKNGVYRGREYNRKVNINKCNNDSRSVSPTTVVVSNKEQNRNNHTLSQQEQSWCGSSTNNISYEIASSNSYTATTIDAA